MDERHIITTAAEIDRALSSAESVPEALTLEHGIAPEEMGALQARLGKARAALKEADKENGVLFSPTSKYGALLQSFVMENRTSVAPLPNGETLEAKFDSKDPGWLATFWQMVKDAKKFDWKQPPPDPEIVPQFASSARVAVFGDWGTGLYGAPVIASSITNDKHDIQMLLHLGDVYYSGTQQEFKSRFSNEWPKRPGAIHRALNGNHEMYSGGQPYFDALQQAPFFQPSTYFAYQNEDWILACLDTAYEEHNLTDDQVSWLNNIVTKATPKQKIVLFSHHQPFSLLSGQGIHLQVKLGNLLTGAKIFAWYWGHEHECVIYDKHPDWNMYGRCIGHGGMPEFRPAALGDTVASRRMRRFEKTPKSPGAYVLDGPNEYIVGEEDKYTPHGYVTLLFDGPKLTEYYHDPDGHAFDFFTLV
jgi:hypothetical protein